MNLNLVLDRTDLWRGGRPAPAQPDSLPSGFASLDALLPGGGWPLGALTEVLIAREGVGALRLVIPALAQLSADDRWLAWVAPPYIPYAPALAAAGVNLSRVLLVHPPERGQARRDALWAAEQALRSGTCGAVLMWLPQDIDDRQLRRLQLAAESGGSWGLLFRPHAAAATPSPAALRLLVEPAGDEVAVHVLKRRGGWPTGPVYLELDHALAVPPSAPLASGGLYPGQLRQ